MSASLMISNRQSWFGHGTLSRLVPLLASDPLPTLLFSCRSFLDGPHYARLAGDLAPKLLATEVIRHEASPQHIDHLVTRYRGQVRRVVAIGGGSVLDAAKAFAALSQHPLPALRYLEKVGDTLVSGATLPLIAIPTTAGTGSEVTQNAVLTDTRTQRVKASLRHPNFVPQVAILDPALLNGAPDEVLAGCGIDAFTHLFESWLSKNASAWSRQLSLCGIRLFLQAWPHLNRQDTRGDQAREAMMQASWLGGLTLSMAGLGVIHGLAGEIGALRSYPHGQVCGRLLLPFLSLLATSQDAHQRARMTELAQAVLPDGDRQTPERRLTDLITGQSVFPFWLEPLTITAAELQTIVEKSNSKHSLLEYSSSQRRSLTEQAFSVN
ncbi:iron-containing alcohol dehydrogenase [Affinibrenneria salicis]|uniref:Iron-containing alcohol dehydrogenase n=1 Tax=Affinibrenneria salicis TaxID=2590031 RepID=A0A5J5FUM3_9GAMM|nr:iron-containing alcohol dehydrogenase [Affinibrenneria salicis]KAA8997374.1 iron-containing alcohol dehydrogenase [Affinibrenneria salicis]